MLLIASPIHTSLVDHDAISEFMKPYVSVLIEGKNAIQANKDHADPFRRLVQLPEVPSSGTPSGASEIEEERDESSEWYVEEMDEGVDCYMFPRTMGYLVLEQQYLMCPSLHGMRRSSVKAEQEARDQQWQAFIQRIGGVESLSFHLTRQSGNRWKLFNVTQEDRNRDTLRQLIHAGVGTRSRLQRRSRSSSAAMCGTTYLVRTRCGRRARRAIRSWPSARWTRS